MAITTGSRSRWFRKMASKRLMAAVTRIAHSTMRIRRQTGWDTVDAPDHEDQTSGGQARYQERQGAAQDQALEPADSQQGCLNDQEDTEKQLV